MKKKHLIILLILLLFRNIILFSQSIQQLGYYNVNGVSAFTSIKDYMILGNGDIVDIRNPSSPTLISNCLVGINSSVMVEGNYVYFGKWMSSELNIVDISDPYLPIKISTLLLNKDGGIFGLAKRGDTLYLAAGNDGVYCIDISDKSNPELINTIIIPDGQTRDIVIKDDYAYLAHYDGLKIIDLKDPLKPVINKMIGSTYYSIDIKDNKVFMGAESGGFDVFDISDPTNPLTDYIFNNRSINSWDIKVNNDFVYLATNSEGLYIYKVEEKSYNEILHFPNRDNGQTFCVVIQDNLIMVSGLVNGIAILNFDAKRKMQTINFDPLQLKNIGEGSFELTATSSSGLPVSYTSSNVNVATIEGNLLTIHKPGKTNITAFQEGDTLYIPAISVVQQLIVTDPSKLDQIITFTELPNKNSDDLPFKLEAVSSSGLPVIFRSSDSAIVSINGNIAKINKSGNVTLVAYQDGNDLFNPAVPFEQVLIINQGLTITRVNKGSITIHSNSAEKTILLSLNNGMKNTVIIYDLIGNISYSNKNFIQKELLIDLKNSKGGVYIVKIINETENLSAKIRL